MDNLCVCPSFPFVPLLLNDEETPAYEGSWNRCCLVAQFGFWDHLAKYTTYSD